MRRLLLVHYVPSIVLRELLRCERWTPEQRATALTTAGFALLPAIPLALVAELWWLVTGGGPVRWLGLTRAVVNPLRLSVPPAVRAAAARSREAAVAEHRSRSMLDAA